MRLFFLEIHSQSLPTHVPRGGDSSNPRTYEIISESQHPCQRYVIRKNLRNIFQLPWLEVDCHPTLVSTQTSAPNLPQELLPNVVVLTPRHQQRTDTEQAERHRFGDRGAPSKAVANLAPGETGIMDPDLVNRHVNAIGEATEKDVIGNRDGLSASSVSVGPALSIHPHLNGRIGVSFLAQHEMMEFSERHGVPRTSVRPKTSVAI